MNKQFSNQPLVSIIMNCYNGEDYLCESIESVLSQTYKNWELIFWDNKSEDKSAEIFKSYKDKRFKYYYASQHTPLYDARNQAIEKSTGEFVAFLDTDDFWEKDKLELQLPLFKDSKVGVVYGNLFIVNEKLNIIFCIGETFKEKKSGKTFSILKKQIRSSLEKKFNINKIIFAYEPVWSIGTNKIPKMNELENTIKFIKNEFKKAFKTKKSPKVLYGGSVNDENICLFSLISEIDGFLIGGASQSSKKFIDIVKNYYK